MKPPNTFQMFVLYLFHQMCWKIDCYPLLKSTVLINIGNSFCIPLSFPFKWSNCIPEVALFSGCYWSPCFLTQISHYPYLPPSQEHTRVHTKTHMIHIHGMEVSKLIGFLHADYMKKQNINTKHLNTDFVVKIRFTNTFTTIGLVQCYSHQQIYQAEAGR